MSLEEVKKFWEKDNFLNIKPITGDEFPEGIDVIQFIKDFFRDIKYDSIVELGCGYGRLCKAFDDKKYIGTDISKTAVKRAKELSPDYNFIDYSHPKADIYFAYTVFLHLTDDELDEELSQINSNQLVISEILGKVWANNGNSNYIHTYNRELSDYDNILKKHGFERKKTDKFFYEHYRKFKKDRDCNLYFLLYSR